MVKGAKDLSGASFIKALIPFLKVLSSLMHHLWELGFQHTDFGGYIQTTEVGSSTALEPVHALYS